MNLNVASTGTATKSTESHHRLRKHKTLAMDFEGHKHQYFF